MTASSATCARNTISELHSIARGTEGPLALCMHGITANAHVFEPLMALLAPRFRVVAIDQRGHGRSPKPASGYRAEDFASDIEPFLPAFLVGHSLGARNALVAGARYPGKVLGVVAIDFTPYIEDEVFDALDSRVGAGDRAFSSEEEIRSYLQNRYARIPPEAVERRARYGYEQKNGEWRALASPSAMQQICTGLRDDLVPAVRGIRVPALLVRGKESKLVSPAAWAKTRALRPDLPAVEIEDADHYVHEEQPAAVAAAVLRFWDSIARRSQ